MKFHIAHIIPHPRMHGLNGYKEVIDTVVWGLGQLGHKVSYGINEISPDARNIVFGAQVLPLEAQKQLKDDTIVYNFEQMRNGDMKHLRPEMKAYAERLQVWDYSPFNLSAWSQLELKHEVITVPVGYAPIIERISKPKVQDIDVLIYGLTNEDRLSVFHALAQNGLSVVFACGLYGESRDSLIARSKIIVNASMYSSSKIFEVVRVSYLMANKKAVVSYDNNDTAIESDIVGGFQSSSGTTLIPDVLSLIHDDKKRRELEIRGYEVIRNRDVRNYLTYAFEKMESR